MPGRRRGAAAGGGLSDTLGTFTTTANASYGINSLLGAGNVGGKPRSAGIHSDPAAGNEIGNQNTSSFFPRYLTTSLCPLMLAFKKGVSRQISLPFKSMFFKKIQIKDIWQHLCVHSCKRLKKEYLHKCLYYSNQCFAK